MSPDQVAREKRAMRDGAVDWLRANSRGGPSNDPVTDTAAGIDRVLGNVNCQNLLANLRHIQRKAAVERKTIKPAPKSKLANGKMTFDYTLREGVVTKSNGLELMRSIGLDV